MEQLLKQPIDELCVQELCEVISFLFYMGYNEEAIEYKNALSLSLEMSAI